MCDSLWGEEFSPQISVSTPKVKKSTLVHKPITTDQKLKSKTTPVEEKLRTVESEVHRILGHYEEDTITIKSIEEFKNYIDVAISNKIIAIDTETNNSLDPVNCKIMGLCIYTPNMKNAYIPVNHVDINTKKRFDWQIDEEQIKNELNRLNDNNVYCIYHNGKFDYEVLKCTCGVVTPINWDTLIGAKILNENESAALKHQYRTYIDKTQEKYDIENLFEHLEYAIVKPELFALYAATDSYITYKLYEYQLKEFIKEENNKLYKLFTDIEMPLVEVLANMELNGMAVDQEYAKRLSNKYHNQLDAIDEQIKVELEKLKPRIDAWRLTPEANSHQAMTEYGPVELKKSKSEQLAEDINLASPTQLAILFYDILKCPQVNKKSPRSTGEEDIKAIAEKTKLPICDLILKRRGQVKLLTTYIDTIPELANRWADGRVRTHFNQYGADTGRLSSSDPLNFQNIPSHDKSIRMLFKAEDGYRIIGGDFSQQEPKLTAHYSQDENMINAYLEGKDLYAIIASKSFNKSYEDCLEFYPEGTEIEFEGQKIICGYKTHIHDEGKKTRTMAKSILLGLLYGRGAPSIGEQIKKSKEEAQEIIDSFYKGFPKVKKWIDESISNAHTYGYVEDVVGRRRRLPDIQLPEYTLISTNNKTMFNPLLNSDGKNNIESLNKIENYKKLLSKAVYKSDVDKIKANAFKDGIEIKNNKGFIAQAERQAVNARVQGGAATLTKCALNLIYRDERLNKLGAKLINTVHDEILMEVPEQYSEEAEKYLQDDMIQSAKPYVPEVPMKCDTYNVTHWYEDEYEVIIRKEFDDVKATQSLSDIDIVNKLISSHTETLPNRLREIIGIDKGE